MTTVDERPMRESEAASGPAIRPELEHALRREVERALQPVLADFRKESVQAVREQVAQAHVADRENRLEGQTAPEAGREERPSPPRQRDRDPEPTNDSEGQSLLEQATAQTLTVASEVVEEIPGFLEQMSTQWFQSRIQDGRDTLCSEPTRLRLRKSLEQVLKPFVEAGLDLVPDSATRRALQHESESALDALINDTLEQVCSEQVLDEVKRHGDRAIHAFAQGDVGTTLREVWEVVHALIRAFVAAVQDQWQHFAHLVLDLFLRVMQEVVGKMLKEGLATIAAVPVQEIEEKAETAKETVKDKGAELRDRLAERFETLQERVKDEVGQVKERVADGLKSAVDDGTRNSSFGRPPTGRPPSVRPPSGRPPTGRPPSARPPSGRPPSMSRQKG